MGDNMKKYLSILLLGLVLIGCQGEKSGKIEDAIALLIRTKIEKEIHAVPDRYPDIPAEEKSRRREMWAAIVWRNTDALKEYLVLGYDPNQCLGEEGWQSSNPLGMVMRQVYFTYKDNISIPPLIPDEAMLNVLVKWGADINKLPFIWLGVYVWNNYNLERIQYHVKGENDGSVIEVTQEEADKEKALFVKDVNRLMNAFLEAGADPDKLGHPYPYDPDMNTDHYWTDLFMSDEEANTYFAQGSRPINEVIKKGIVWESQVDLLLRYSSIGLDEASLEAAHESNDPAMIGKISRLWIEQHRGE
jgi:hypothetical protein